ncbi:multidrug efflux SMR transporter [Cupriavidus necator]|uniref:Guanidinium exporter n=1 Tax=Cupriavidus necator TaxID=106590 RepID=A0A367PQD5_CUPNE|nr:multidrug efflux SMR transporter [Cupriavidus necator]QQX85101.1 multidrug efflux SMR transporter [Cupriavidus necator]RCJ09266.1 QacE family quaternary ammonium compound efflux SMR transporter [Cupriavidus necator]
MSWSLLAVAGLLEIAFAFGMKWSAGFSRFWPSVYAVATGMASILLLTLSLRVLPVGTAYAVWTGIGAAGTAMVGMLWLGEPASLARMGCIALILGGVVGLKLVSGPAP